MRESNSVYKDWIIWLSLFYSIVGSALEKKSLPGTFSYGKWKHNGFKYMIFISKECFINKDSFLCQIQEHVEFYRSESDRIHFQLFSIIIFRKVIRQKYSEV